MAGRGRRFVEAGYLNPKPFIGVGSKRMVDHAISCLPEGRVVALCAPDAPPVGDVQLTVPEVTQGAACTVLMAAPWIDNDEPLLIANCDQWVDWDPQAFAKLIDQPLVSGAVAVFNEPGRDPKWSYARVGVDWYITDVVEKQPVSDWATCGVYLFARGRDFCDEARRMISDDERVNGEFYVAPVIGRMCRSGWNFLAAPVNEMVGLGTPEDLEANRARFA
jgi:dTDP-glucose pyrophosphorylase